ncbi:MAG: hypothetical protein PHF00_11465 [Elusimicrobia bacterium]|nr:hypothetical protein [Elusimicrobiota bacterium]
MDESQAPPPPGRYWLYLDKRMVGPYGARLLRRMKEFGPRVLAAPAGARTDEAWKPAEEYPELKALLEQRAAAAAAPPPGPQPQKRKGRPPLAPLPEGPNYFAGLLGLSLAVGAAVLGFQAWRAKSGALPVSSGGLAAQAEAPVPVWPEPGALAERVQAEGQLLESYFPMLLSREGVRPEQFAAVCDAAKDFASGCERYRAAFGEAALASFSQRIGAAMRADSRPSALLERLRLSKSRGIDLSSLEHPAQLRGNVAAVDYGMEHALANARLLLRGVCKE